MSEKISRRNFLRTATLGAAAAGLLAGCGNSAASGSTAASTAAGTYTAGTYSATATGINTTTPVTVTMTFNADTITDVQIDVANETKGYGADIADEMVKKILDAQSSEVDGHSGATITSDAIKKAAESCINQAKGVAVAPTFNQHRTFAFQLSSQNIVGNSFSVVFHSEHLVSIHTVFIIHQKYEFYNSFPMIGEIIFRRLATNKYVSWL